MLTNYDVFTKSALNRWFERTFSIFFCSKKIDLLGIPLSKACCFRICWINNVFNANLFQTFWGKLSFLFRLGKWHEQQIPRELCRHMIMAFKEPRWLAMKNYQATGGLCFSDSQSNNNLYLEFSWKFWKYRKLVLLWKDCILVEDMSNNIMRFLVPWTM